MITSDRNKSIAGLGSHDIEIRVLALTSPFVIAAAVWLYYPTLASLVFQWKGDPYYSHGPLLPVVVAYLIWGKRAALREAWETHQREPSHFAGLLLCGLGIQLVGALVDVGFVKALSIPVVLLGIARFIGGAAVERELRFPLLYLEMAVPLTRVLVEFLSFPLQLDAARYASVWLGLLGIPVNNSGVNIATNRYAFVVDVPCSGLKTTITLLTLALLVVYLLPDLTRLERWALCLMSAPIALIANMMRIIVIVVLGHRFGEKAAQGFLHSLSGVFVLLVSVIILIALSWAIHRTRRPEDRTPSRRAGDASAAPAA